MEGKSRFTPGQISKALRLLRELPVKDGRKNIQETLRLLEQDMKDALDKGYSRGDIRRKIAEAEVTVSATTLKGFLAEAREDAGRKRDGETVGTPENFGRHRERESVEKMERAGRKLNEDREAKNVGREHTGELAGRLSPGSIIIKPDTPREEL